MANVQQIINNQTHIFIQNLDEESDYYLNISGKLASDLWTEYGQIEYIKTKRAIQQIDTNSIEIRVKCDYNVRAFQLQYVESNDRNIFEYKDDKKVNDENILFK